MKIGQMGYQITELPGWGSIFVEMVDEDVRGRVRFLPRADADVSYDLSELRAWLAAFEHAVRLGEQMEQQARG